MKKILLAIMILFILTLNSFAGGLYVPYSDYKETESIFIQSLNFDHERQNLLTEIDSLQAQINGLSIENRTLLAQNSKLWVENTSLKKFPPEKIIEQIIEKEVIPWWGWALFVAGVLFSPL